ncbi:MAG TPA: pilus (MSHA type) biogenesis protein MshL, partial [Burkholderiales bacterium]|nr:pilus (MSHA type) biogenesis protein MshL [Burkholderiales bacterium]
PAPPEAVAEALIPPLVIEMPRLGSPPVEPRFDLAVNSAPASQVFLAIVSGTQYSMLVHPDVKDTISVNLKNVTVLEALDTLRELHGYDYKVQGTRITVQPMTLQTRVFHINYLQAQRRGRTDVRVTSGSITDAPSVPASGVPSSTATPTARLTESTRVTTSSDSDFWADVTKSLQTIIGNLEGRSVIVNPQSGVIVVRAYTSELRNVERFLNAMQIVVERQVVLEAKIIEVTLREGYEAGVNWAAFRHGDPRLTTGVVTPGTTIGNTGTIATPVGRSITGSASASSSLTATLGTTAALAASPATPGGIFGLALQTGNFAALLTFLETQGTVNVLSSPRIATVNNQKAVLKVGTDEYFVTNVSTTAVTSGAGVTTTPTITVQPFFSGIALDVTPQIDDNHNIILHVHPSVSEVSEKRKDINLGTIGTFTLPLASSNINETDTIVRVQDSNIVAIGGLMRQQTTQDRSRIPGAADIPVAGAAFRQRATATIKSELVILLKPTIIHSDRNWQQDLMETRERMRL